MRQVIYKFELEMKDVQTIEMPDGAIIMSSQIQDDKIMVWALCNKPSFKSSRVLHIIGTGEEMELRSKDLRFIDTVQLNRFVWHVFEEI